MSACVGPASFQGLSLIGVGNASCAVQFLFLFLFLFLVVATMLALATLVAHGLAHSLIVKNAGDQPVLV